MSVLTTSGPPAPDEKPTRQGGKRSKQAREARQVERAERADQAAKIVKEPKGTKLRGAKERQQPKPAPAPKTGASRRAAAPTSTAVNLLSPWVLEELRVHHLRRRFVVGAILLVVVLGVVAGGLRVHLGNVEQRLADQEASSSGLQAQINDLADVKIYVGNVALRATDVEDVMSTDVALHQVMTHLVESLPPGATFDAVTIDLASTSLSSEPTSAASEEELVCPGPDPFGTKDVVGCIQISGVADSRADVSALVKALAGSKLFVEPFITTTTVPESAGTGAADQVTFEGSVALSRSTLTERYSHLDGSDATREDGN